MTKSTNINLTYNNHTFNYLVEYANSVNTRSFDYVMENKSVRFSSELIRRHNFWNTDKSDYSSTIISQTTDLYLYFPDYSIETYLNGGIYILDVHTYIADQKIILGSFLLNRLNAVAADKIVKFLDQTYYECIKVSIPDPYSIIYSDDFYQFRKDIKGEEDYNNDCTNLMISLHPVQLYKDQWVIKDYCGGGQNSILISNNISDFLHTELKYQSNKFLVEFYYNNSYKNLDEYLKETYKWDISTLRIKHDMRLVSSEDGITGKDSKYYANESYNIVNMTKYPYESFYINDLDIYRDYLNSWEKYKPGLGLVCFTHIFINGLSDEHQRLCLCSNTIPLTPEIFSKIICEPISNELKNDIQNYLNEDMNVIEIPNVINVKETTDSSVYDVDHSYTKSNRIVPVFYRVRELGNLVIHPEVTENICINLDAYKSKVEYFNIQIEGVKFKEYGITNSGTVFKIIGERLPKSITSGTYYILNQNNELVVTGKYIYEL